METEALHPLLWLAADGRGRPPEKLNTKKPFVVVEDGGYALLFDDGALSDLVDVIGEGIAHVFVFTDYEDAYAEAATTLGPTRQTHMIPRDYLEHFGP
jgi:hypothetical protein